MTNKIDEQYLQFYISAKKATEKLENQIINFKE